MTDPGLFLPSPDGKDYQKLFEKYQEKFNKAYLRSVALCKAEKVQRQALYSYKRRINALLDLCGDLDEDSPTSNDLCSERIANLIDLNPKLASTILNVLKLDDEKTPISEKHRRNLYLNEIVPDAIGDQLDHVEINPQEPESWVRRHYPHLVVSKFKPLVALPTLMVDSTEGVARNGINHVKRKRTRVEDDEMAQKLVTTPQSVPSAKKLKTKLIITGPTPVEPINGTMEDVESTAAPTSPENINLTTNASVETED